MSEVWEHGGKGGVDLANKLLSTLETKPSDFKPLYEDQLSLTEKIEKIAREIYGASSVTFEKTALNELKKIEGFGYGNLPVCIAKTQYSLSDDPTKLEGLET